MDGEAEITIAGKMPVVKKGELIILPANVPHALNAVRPFKMLLTMIKSEDLWLLNLGKDQFQLSFRLT